MFEGPLARLQSSPFAQRVTRYALGSVFALITSVVVFALLLLAGFDTTVCSILAFVAGAVPNWVLNRKWAWGVKGKLAWGREIVGYVIVSVLSLIASSEGTGAMQHWVRHNVGHGVRLILVTAAYVFVQAVLFVVKFVVYEHWVFAGRSRVRAALRSRHQVWMTARANRNA